MCITMTPFALKRQEVKLSNKPFIREKMEETSERATEEGVQIYTYLHLGEYIENTHTQHMFCIIGYLYINKY